MFFKRLFLSGLLIFQCFFTLSWSCPAFAATQAEHSLSSMSMKDLLNVQIETSNLTSTSVRKSTSAITIIRREQIERTPARNIIDLLEVYVPGLMVNSSFTAGPQFRIRGLGERHNHTLLLVNGKPVNQKGFQGSMVELRNWDMGDIERLEVVRGAGSVTHGPGAIGGVINIITRRAVNEEGLQVGFMSNPTYDSTGYRVSHGSNVSGTDMYFYASKTRTKGIDEYDFYQMLGASGAQGYKGTDDFTGSESNPLQAYYADYDDKPQIKLYVDINFSTSWRFWARYNNGGQSGTNVQKEFNGEFQDWRSFDSEYYIFSLENDTALSDSVNLKSILSYDSENYIDMKAKRLFLSNTHELNLNYAFTEDEIYFRSVLEYLPTESLSIANAIAFSHDSLSAPWGEGSGSFIANAGGQVFIEEGSVYDGDGSGGTYKPSKVAKYTDGWSTNTYSLSSEIKYQASEALQLIVSARVDKNDLTDILFSPRIAMLYEMSKKNSMTASWQRSLRMNTMMELYWLDINNEEPDPEHNTTFEVSFRHLENENFYYSLTSYYNESEIYAWAGSNVDLVGVIKSFGIEPEISFHSKNVSFGINHSYFELLDWDFRLKQGDGSLGQDISYSDWLYTKDYLTTSSTGSSLNNWVNQYTKLWLDINLDEVWSVHLDARIIWEYEYGKDLFSMYNNAFDQVDTSVLSAGDLTAYNEDKEALAAFNETISDKKVYGRDVRINISSTWKILPLNARFTVYVQNLLDITGNKRQKNSFTTKTLPTISWIEEPRTIGLSYTQDF